MNYFYKSLIILTLVAAHSCTLNDDLDINLHEQSKQIIVEGYLMPGNPFEITLIESSSLNNALENSPVKDANVYITVKDTIYQLSNTYKWIKNRQLLVNYRSDKILNVDPNTKINLNVVTKNNDSLSASTVSLAPAAIQGCEYYGDEVVVSLSGNHYLRVSICDFSKESISKSFFINFSKPVGNDEIREDIRINVPKEFRMADSLDVRLFTISEDYYQYMKSVKNAESAYFDSFIAPEKIKSNIYGGIGIFTFYTMERRILKIKKL